MMPLNYVREVVELGSQTATPTNYTKTAAVTSAVTSPISSDALNEIPAVPTSSDECLRRLEEHNQSSFLLVSSLKLVVAEKGKNIRDELNGLKEMCKTVKASKAAYRILRHTLLEQYNILKQITMLPVPLDLSPEVSVSKTESVEQLLFNLESLIRQQREKIDMLKFTAYELQAEVSRSRDEFGWSPSSDSAIEEKNSEKLSLIENQLEKCRQTLGRVNATLSEWKRKAMVKIGTLISQAHDQAETPLSELILLIDVRNGAKRQRGRLVKRCMVLDVQCARQHSRSQKYIDAHFDQLPSLLYAQALSTVMPTDAPTQPLPSPTALALNTEARMEYLKQLYQWISNEIDRRTTRIRVFPKLDPSHHVVEPCDENLLTIEQQLNNLLQKLAQINTESEKLSDELKAQTKQKSEVMQRNREMRRTLEQQLIGQSAQNGAERLKLIDKLAETERNLTVMDDMVSKVRRRSTALARECDGLDADIVERQLAIQHENEALREALRTVGDRSALLQDKERSLERLTEGVQKRLAQLGDEQQLLDDLRRHGDELRAAAEAEERRVAGATLLEEQTRQQLAGAGEKLAQLQARFARDRRLRRSARVTVARQVRSLADAKATLAQLIVDEDVVLETHQSSDRQEVSDSENISAQADQVDRHASTQRAGADSMTAKGPSSVSHELNSIAEESSCTNGANIENKSKSCDKSVGADNATSSKVLQVFAELKS